MQRKLQRVLLACIRHAASAFNLSQDQTLIKIIVCLKLILSLTDLLFVFSYYNFRCRALYTLVPKCYCLLFNYALMSNYISIMAFSYCQHLF